MKHDSLRSIQPIDTTNCSQEPIRIPGRIQPHGVLLALSSTDWVVRHASANCVDLLGVPVSSLVGQTLDSVIEPVSLGNLLGKLALSQLHQENPIRVKPCVRSGKSTDLNAIAHWSEGLLILELEELEEPERSDNASEDVSFSNIYRRMNGVIAQLELSSRLSPSLPDVNIIHELCRTTAEQVKALTGFHRVMIYQFDSEWNGVVVAEAKETEQEPFLGLHYPASDIPAQARELYKSNWIRLIPDVFYQPVDIIPPLRQDNSKPLDLSLSVLRSVSPIHVQYLKNMKVGASMSVSLIKEGQLWGLIAFHHDSARYLSYEMRQGLEFIGKFFSLQLSVKEKHENVDYKQELQKLQGELVLAMRSAPEFLDGLVKHDPNLLALVGGASGAVIAYRKKTTKIGNTPNDLQLSELTQWLKTRVGQTPMFLTTSLAKEYPAAENFKDQVSGMLVISIPEPDPSYVIWFKPEVIQTVNWGGNPEKAVEITECGTQLSPRRSFALWQETVQFKSLPFQTEEIEVIEDLRRSIIEVDLEHQVISAIKSNEELDQFAHVISHDLKEPLRGIRNLAEFLNQDAGGKLTKTEYQNLREIKDLAGKGQKLISELYEYSRLGRVELALVLTNLNDVVADVQARLRPLLKEHNAEVLVRNEFPQIRCDHVRVAEVFANLITNAVRYNESPKKYIEVGLKDPKKEEDISDGSFQSHLATVFYVKDNGIGIKFEDQFRVFQMFERLHGPELYGGGTGSGLAIVKRIIDKHSGRIWVESTEGQGTTFFFTLGSKNKA